MPPIDNIRRIPSQPINPRITVGQTLRGGLFEERKDAVFEEAPAPVKKIQTQRMVEEKKTFEEPAVKSKQKPATFQP